MPYFGRFKRYNSGTSQWVDATLKRYSGGSWINISTTIPLQRSLSNYIWAMAGSLNTTKSRMAGCGGSRSALCIGGYTSAKWGTPVSVTEKFYSISWVTTSSLNSSCGDKVAVGNVSSAFLFGMFSTTDNAESWNGSAWSTLTNHSVVRTQIGGCGGATNAVLAIGGLTSTNSNVTEIWNGSSWATTGALNTARYNIPCCGTTSNALTAGGSTGSIVDNVEVWNGSTWATTTAIPDARYHAGLTGTYNDAILFGGVTGSTVPLSVTHKWNGSTWATTTSLGATRGGLGEAGSQTDALAFGGYMTASGSVVHQSVTERWTKWGDVYSVGAGNWTVVSPIITARVAMGALGAATSTLIFGGSTGGSTNMMDNVEKWDGSAWATTTSLSSTIKTPAGLGGSSSSGLYAGGGITSSRSSDSYKWNGSSWATTGALNTARSNISGCGSTSSGLSFGGYVGSVAWTCEKWDGSAWATTTSLALNRMSAGGCGTTSAALCVNGSSTTSYMASNSTQIWDGSAWATTTATNISRSGATATGNISSALCFSYIPTEIWNGSSWATTTNMICGQVSNGTGSSTSTLCVSGYYTNGSIYGCERWYS